jgi:hypothetical protein
MATTTSLTTTYAGKYAGEVIKPAFLANESMQYLTLRENIDYKQVVRKLVDDVSFAAGTCDFTPTGTVAITERILTLEKFQVQRELCKQDFLTDWTANDAQNGRLASEISQAMIDNMLGQIAEKNESLIWQGVNANVGEYAGFITLWLADAGVIDVTGAAAITTANIFSKLQDLVDQAPDRVKRATEKPLIYMGQDVWEKFIFANASAGNGWYTYAGGAVPPTFMGLFAIAVCPGMPANTMALAQKSNLWFGTNLLNDWNQVALLDMTDKDLSENVRFSAKFFAGLQYGFSDEITLYTV